MDYITLGISIAIGLAVCFILFRIYFRILPEPKEGYVYVLERKSSRWGFSTGNPESHGVAMSKNQPGIISKPMIHGDKTKLLLRSLWVVHGPLEVVKISSGSIGIVEALKGHSRQDNNILKPVPSSHFEDAHLFLSNQDDNQNYTGEVGIQTQFLTANEYPRINPKIFKVKEVLITNVSAQMIGIVTSMCGKVADSNVPPKVVESNSYSDASEFILNGGISGIQRDHLQSGKHSINTELFKVDQVPKTVVPDGEIGIVFSKFGEPLSDGQILGRKIECANFQDADKFLNLGGQIGPQRHYLKSSGEYSINTKIFTVITSNTLDDYLKSDETEAGFIITSGQLKPVEVKSNEVGIITTRIGNPLVDTIAAPRLSDLKGGLELTTKIFQDPHGFVDAGGYSGLQLELLTAGIHYINPLFATVKKSKFVYIPEDKVGVQISSFEFVHIKKSEEENNDSSKEIPNDEEPSQADLENDLNQIKNIGKIKTEEEAKAELRVAYDKLHEIRQSLVNKGKRGVMREVLPTGYHAINTDVYRIETVPTNEIILEWNDKEKPSTNYDASLKSIEIFTKDKYKLKVEVTQSIRIDEANAPVMVRMVGAQGEDIGETDENGTRNIKSTSIKSLVSKVLASSVQQFFINAAAAFDAYDFIEAEQDKIRNIIARDIKTALIARGVTALNTTFSVIGDSIPELLKKRIEDEHKDIDRVASMKRKVDTLKQEEKTSQSINEHNINETKRNLKLKEEEQKTRDHDLRVKIAEEKLLKDLEQFKKIKDLELELKKLSEETRLKGGPRMAAIPEVLKAFPKQFENVRSLILGNTSVNDVSGLATQIKLISKLLADEESFFDKNLRGEKNTTDEEE